MAHGVPNIVSDAGGLPELVAHQKSGLVFPVNDRNALMNSIKILLGHGQLCQKMATAGKARLIELFNIKKTIKDTAQLYTFV
jgi:glycosyltransferase involved in cell wall biosynthesis